MKKKENEKIEQPSLSDEQLEIFSAHMDKNSEDRSEIEPFDNSIQAKAMRYAKKNKKTTNH